MERSLLVVQATTTREEDGVKAILALDLGQILTKLQKPAPRGAGWTPNEAATADKWYRRFLIIGLKNPGTTIVPNEQVDELWHAHVLNMRQYEEDTTQIFGSILYHAPTFGECDLRPHFAKTNELLRAEFGEDLNSSGDYEPTSCCCYGDPASRQSEAVAISA